MAKKKSGKCMFCAIGNGEDEKTVPLYKDEDYVVFKDIKPAAPHHYLVCPIKHIKDAKALQGHHLDMVTRMIEIGKQVLEEKGGNIADARLGFHWPPFTSVDHLHMHVISPADKIKTKYKLLKKYHPNVWWYESADWLVDRLSKMPNEFKDESKVVPSPES